MGRGDYPARLGEERHERLAKLAAERGCSMNQLLCEAVDLVLSGEGISSSGAVRQALAQLAAVARQLGQGFVLVPASEAGDQTWSDIVNGQGRNES